MPQEPPVYQTNAEDIETSILDRILPSRAEELEEEKRRREELAASEKRIRDRLLTFPEVRAQSILDKMRGGSTPTKKRKVFNTISDVLGMYAGISPMASRARKQALEEYKVESEALGREQTVIGAEQRAALSAQQRAETSRQNQALRYIDIKRREAADLVREADMLGNKELKEKALALTQRQVVLAEDIAPIKKELEAAKIKFTQAGTRGRAYDPSVLADTFARSELNIDPADERPEASPGYIATYQKHLKQLRDKPPSAPSIRIFQDRGPRGEVIYDMVNTRTGQTHQVRPGRISFSEKDQDQIEGLEVASADVEELFNRVSRDFGLASPEMLLGPTGLTIINKLTPDKLALFQQESTAVMDRIRSASGLQTSAQERSFIQRALPRFWYTPQNVLHGLAFYRAMAQSRMYRKILGATSDEIDMTSVYRNQSEAIEKAMQAGNVASYRLPSGLSLVSDAAATKGYEIELDDENRPIRLVRK